MVAIDQISLTFLKGKKSLTKRISESEVTPYPHLKFLTSCTEEINSPLAFHQTVKKHSKKGYALLVGNLIRPIVQASRAGLTDKTKLTRWLCLDFDNLPGYSVNTALLELEKVWPGISKTSH